MDQSNEYERAKMEIRGLLISNKEGCHLSEFKKQYLSLLGCALPFSKFGYKNEFELLSSMPDAVHIRSTGNDYYLFGIADEKSKHIQKMISKQKPSRKKPLGRLAQRYVPPNKRYELPPSFATKRSDNFPSSFAPRKSNESKQSFAPKWSNELQSSSVPRTLNEAKPSFSPKWSNKLQTSSVTRTSNELKPSFASKLSNELQSSSVPRTSNELKPSSYRKLYELPPRFQPKVKKELPKIVMNEIVDLVYEYRAGLSLRDVLTKYRETYNKELSFKDYGFFTLQDCLEEIPALFLKPKDNDTIVFCLSETIRSYSQSSKMSYKICRDDPPTSSKVPMISKTVSPICQSFDIPDSSNHLYSEGLPVIPFPNENTSNSNDHGKPDSALSSFKQNYTSDFEAKANNLNNFNSRENLEASTISENIRDNIMKVIANYPHGIWAKEFPTLYKNITRTEFDLHALGFFNLASLIDSMPDILIRRSLPSSKKDYLIFPAWSTKEMDREDPKSAAFAIEIIIGNIRKILQANQEGIIFKDFLFFYSLNCRESLYYAGLGFDNLENFLTAIADRVPLKFEINDGIKTVHLVLPKEKSPLKSPDDLEPSFNIASPFKQFTQQTLPPEMDLSQYFPVFVSTVLNPHHIYIQLQGEDTSGALVKEYENLEKFYCSSLSKSYMMKDFHITSGSIGVALWPVDKHWYRIRIVSVISPDTVQVLYVDYGTIEIIPKNLLRYIREEFLAFPTQAIKASLAFVQPTLANNTWNSKAKDRILELCTDITVMALVDDIKDGLLSLLLCDTNGEEDVYINDVLLRERLVRGPSYTDSDSQFKDSQCLSEIPPPTPPATLTTDPAQVIGMLLQAYSSVVANKASPITTSNLPIDPVTITAAVAQAVQNLSQKPPICGVDFPKQFQASSTYINSSIPSPKPPDSNSWQCAPASLEKTLTGETTSHSSCSPPSEECEIFDELDDAFFDEFYQKVSLVTKRHVKRIRTGDDYIFHILIYESKPFVSCGDICNLIWYDKDSDYLLQRLQNRESVFPNTLLWENENEDMFDQLRRFHVKGFKKMNDQTCILVYPLNTLVQILNVFGHPSAELRSRILSESSSFDPKHHMWMELSEVEIPDEEEQFAGKTDDDKLNRLCFYDLQTMKQGICIRLQKLELLRSKSLVDVSDKEDKLRLLYNKVIGRIKEIDQICSNFADS